MRRSYFIALFVGFMGTGLAGYGVIQSGILPVALVNRVFISARDFNESVDSVEHYYREIAKQSGSQNAGQQIPPSIEVKRAALDKLIENVLIENALEARMPTGEIETSVSAKISALEEIKTPQFGDAVTALYGISADRFMELVLEPKAREELFAEAISAGGARFEEAIQELRENARVRIIVPGLHWENAGVIVRGR